VAYRLHYLIIGVAYTSEFKEPSRSINPSFVSSTGTFETTHVHKQPSYPYIRVNPAARLGCIMIPGALDASPGPL
jgi:hypothetical protein